MENNDPIAKALNLIPNISVAESREVAVVDNFTDPAEQDFGLARVNYHDLIQTGQDALSELLIVAKQSQAPRAYEVLFNALRMLGEMNTDMVDLHVKRAESQPDQDLRNSNITNNNLFVGSTLEMQKLLKNIKEGKAINGDTNDKED